VIGVVLTGVGAAGVWAAGVQSVGAGAAGMRSLGAPVAGVRARMGKGDGGLLEPLEHPFALGLRSEAGERDSLTLYVVSPVIELAVGSRS